MKSTNDQLIKTTDYFLKLFNGSHLSFIVFNSLMGNADFGLRLMRIKVAGGKLHLRTE
jgi:hypothetical protein